MFGADPQRNNILCLTLGVRFNDIARTFLSFFMLDIVKYEFLF